MSLRASPFAASMAASIALAVSCVQAAEIRAVVGNAMLAATKDLAPKFESATGHKLLPTGEPPGPAFKRLRDGEHFDVVIYPRENIDSLERSGFATAGNAVEVARARMGLAVAKNAVKPDISTPEALKRTLLAVRSIVHSDPARGGAGGLNAVRLFEKLGIADVMKAKTVYPRVHSPAGVAQEVADGRAEMAVNQMHEMALPLLEVIGPFPGDLAQGVSYWATVTLASAEREGARALIDYLRSPAGRSLLEAHGLEAAP